MSKIDYNKRAVTLAKELLGKIIVHNDKKYMITVTEAYPFDEENNGEIKKISYVNKYRSGKGHDALIGEDKIGTCFVFAGMLHIACKGGISKNGGTEYKCDNVLIRGAINVDDSNKFNVEDRYLNYMRGKPCVLCSKLEPLPSQQAIDMKNNDGEIQIQDYQTYNEEDIAECERINIKDTSNYRFYIKKETGFLIKINCGLQNHFFIGKIIR